MMGYAYHEQTEDEAMDVELTTSRCTVFLLTGGIELGRRSFDQRGMGYLAEDEEVPSLQSNTSVVIIQVS